MKTENTGTILDYWGEDMSSTEPFKKGRPAEHEEGVSFVAPWEEPFSGFPEHARRNAMALSLAGENVHLRSIEPRLDWEKSKERDEVKRQMELLVGCSVKSYRSQIFMFVPTDELLFMKTTHRFLEPEQLDYVNSLKVFYNVWEREAISPAAVLCLNKVGQVWVACKANADMLLKCGVDGKKIRVVPIPFFPDDPLLKLREQERKPGPVRFYHIGKWEPRKEQRNIILGFLMAFKPKEAILMMKVNPIATKLGDYPQTIDHAIHECLKDDRVKANGWDIDKVKSSGVVVIKKMLSQEQMLEMHRQGDVYVTLSRGEGFDMPAYDAKLAGNRMLYVPSGGPQDFSTEGDYRVGTTGIIPAHSFYKWGKEATYLDYDIDAAVAGFRTLADAVRNKDGRNIRDMEDDFRYLYHHFAAKPTGERMKAYLEQLHEKTQST